MNLKYVIGYVATVLAALVVVAGATDDEAPPPMAPGPSVRLTAHAMAAGPLMSVEEPARYCWSRRGWSDHCADVSTVTPLP